MKGAKAANSFRDKSLQFGVFDGGFIMLIRWEKDKERLDYPVRLIRDLQYVRLGSNASSDILFLKWEAFHSGELAAEQTYLPASSVSSKT